MTQDEPERVKVEEIAMTAIPDTRAPIEHELKTWASYFHALADGSKNFELRRDDRDYRPGDTLWLRETEYGSGAYTGRDTRRLVTYVLRHEEDLGLIDGFAILSLASVALSVSEKRAEEAERELTAQMVLAIETKDRLVAALGSLEKQLSTAEFELASSQASLLRVAEALKRMITLAEDAGTYVPDSIRLTLCESTVK